MSEHTIQLIFNLLETFIENYGLDLGMCSRDIIATAGTGSYRKNIGSMRPDPYHREVLQHGEPIVLENKRYSNMCRKCLGRTDCPYNGAIYYPLLANDSTNGIIFLLSKEKMGNRVDSYIQFLGNFSEIVKAVNKNNFNNIASKLLFLSFWDTAGDYNIQYSAEGEIQNITSKAKRINFNYNSQVKDLKEHLEKYSKLNDKPDVIEKNVKFTSCYNNYIIDIFNNSSQVNNAILFEPFKSIIGKSNIISKTKQNAKLIASTNSSVLLYGETGTGKELFAEAIHKSSLRKAKDMVSINCSAIPENLVESELFGYVKGAFSGANPEGKKGKFEQANGSTLFLDEIGEMPLHVQAKLLRALENNTIDRIGDSKSTLIDVRIIAATNKNLEKMIVEGKFREDLFYRLNIMKLEIPSLRERLEDIPLLVEHFVERFEQLYRRQLLVEQPVIDSFMNYDWPGNIRELKNVLEYSAGIVSTNLITLDSLPLWYKKSSVRNSIRFPQEPGILQCMEKGVIEKALLCYGTDTEGKRQAAKSLGISLSTLYRKIERNGIL